MFIGTINITIIRWVLSGFLLDMEQESTTLWEIFARTAAGPGTR